MSTALPATLLFDRPSLHALTDHLMVRLDLEMPLAQGAAVSNGPDEVSSLSEEEAEAQLLAELSAPSEQRRAAPGVPQ